MPLFVTRRLLGLAALVSVATLPAANAAGPYAHPLIAIPYALQKPVIDGTVNDAEWRGAATDTLTGQPDCSTSFVGNFAGARQDAIHQPAVGNSRTSSYDTDWEPVSRLTKDNVWEMEVVIPRKSLGTTERPFHDGMKMRALIARNYKRPWEQCSFEGTSGKYEVLVECRDRSGTVLVEKGTTFTKEDPAATYDWWRTTRGSIEKVIPPWTPVTRTENTFGVWGREMEIGPGGLPTRITTQGHDILAAAGTLVATSADGTELTATGAETRTLVDEDHRKTVVVASRCGDLAVSSEVTVEFDGMLKVALTLTPEQPTAVKGLKIVLPYREAMADYIHACTAEIRSGYWYGFTPPGDGRVWDCRMLGDKTMKVGSFIPYLWLGSPKGGLCWFADSDEGWIPNDDAPAIEVHRTAGGRVDLVFNLISSDAVLDAPRTITFAVQASPVKQMHAGWREDKWWCGDTFKNYAHDQNLIFASTPFVVPKHLEQSQALVAAQRKAGQPAVPYFIHTCLPRHLVPELNACQEEWCSTRMSYGRKALCYGGSVNDYMIHRWSQFVEQAGVDGYYSDNIAPLECDNLEHGCGYRLPAGRSPTGCSSWWPTSASGRRRSSPSIGRSSAGAGRGSPSPT